MSIFIIFKNIFTSLFLSLFLCYLFNYNFIIKKGIFLQIKTKQKCQMIEIEYKQINNKNIIKNKITFLQEEIKMKLPDELLYFKLDNPHKCIFDVLEILNIIILTSDYIIIF